jgi:2-polyprenyl-3-methyl-5-hydroxy-6-metoxy-1,4-benzoquinol methylase
LGTAAAQGTTPDDVRLSHQAFVERVGIEDLHLVPDHLARYAFALHWAPGKNVIDLCCGTGYGSRLLEAAGATVVLGVDIDEQAVACARKAFASPRLSFQRADVTQALQTTGVDLAVCFEGIEHVTAPDTLVANIAKHLNAEGVALISTPNGAHFPGGFSGNPYHVKEYTLAEFHTLLARHFERVTMYFQWAYRDPYDFRWTPGNILRFLVPLWLKRMARRLLGRPASGPGLPTVAAASNPLLWRPYPLNYLSQIGLRGAQPHVWLALCERPHVDGRVR